PINPLAFPFLSDEGQLTHNKPSRSATVILDGFALDITSPGRTLLYRRHHPKAQPARKA
ncbi:hypothetical protein HAX54_016301, partial [Datura stramonium]|nr:hypothetical protein [Datura stramonium]